jgi:hypothetical protein
MKPDDDKTATNLVPHPTAGEMADFADGVSTDRDRARVEEHLAECPACREDLRIVVEAMRPSEGTSRRRWLTGAVATMAATAAAVVLLLFAPAMLDDSRDVVRRGPGDSLDVGGSAASFTVVSPATGATVAAGSPRFVWRSAGPDAQYRFHLATAAGDPIAAVTTPDTVVTSLDEARLVPGTEYYWWVDALRADGSNLETSLQRIVVVP